MKNKHYVLLTDWSTSLGTGHIQRMTALLHYLIFFCKQKTILVCKNLPDFFPQELRQYWQKNFPDKCDLIIRDMRDSISAEIIKLKKIAPVVVIDDKGAGRYYADKAVDLLPDEYSEKENLFLTAPFLYGYNFYSEFINKKEINIKEHYDFTLYCGYGAGEEYREFLISLFPEDAKLLLMDGIKIFRLKNKTREETLLTPAEVFCSSKGVLSHFGLSLYEAFLCGCEMVVINPTQYHANLTEKVKHELSLIHCGVYPDIEIDKIKKQIFNLIDKPKKDVRPMEIKGKMLKGFELFCRAVNKL